jgi:hypothetical protein
MNESESDNSESDNKEWFLELVRKSAPLETSPLAVPFAEGTLEELEDADE